LHQREIVARHVAHHAHEDHLAHLALRTPLSRLLGVPFTLLRLAHLHGALHAPTPLHVGHAALQVVLCRRLARARHGRL
jgi:hypothetical protein